MDADTVLRIHPALTDYLKEFDACFGRVMTRRHLDTYVEGQLSDLRSKSVEMIADAAGIPDEVVYRPKHQIALGQVRWALSNGIRFSWLTFDEGYGGKPPFLRALDALGQNYVAELPGNFRAWTRRPAVRYRPHGRERRMGRPPRYPRLKAKSNPTAEVRQYRTIRRHLALSAVSHLFLAEFRLVATGDSTRRAERGKNPDLTVAQVQAATAALAPIWIRGGCCSRKRLGHQPPPFSDPTTKRAPPAATDGESYADCTKKACS